MFATPDASEYTRSMDETDDLLRIDDYPQLALLAWSRVVREITGKDALALYERNWRFVKTTDITEEETALIARLTHQYGRGVLHV